MNPNLIRDIKQYYVPLMSDRIERLSRFAQYDLHCGPVTDCEECGEPLADCTCDNVYPGFEKACEEVRAWCDETIVLCSFEEWSGYLTFDTSEEAVAVAVVLYPKEQRKALFGVLAEYL